jgi:hypothetical protein
MTKKLGVITLVLVFVVMLAVQTAGPAAAQTSNSISVSGSSAAMDFPLSLNFSAHVSSQVNITDIRLKYEVDQVSFARVTSEAFIKFTPASTVNARYTLDMRKVGGLPPGTSLNFWWSIKDVGGNVLDTQAQPFEVKDNRFTWKQLAEGKIKLFWYKGDDSFARSLMSTAQQSLVDMDRNTGASPPDIVSIFIYNGSQDLQGSMIYPSEWTGGVAFTSYNVVAIGISPDNLNWGKGAMAHELTHIVMNQVTFNPYHGLPVWLNEGLAMYSEGPLDDQFSVPLSKALSGGSLISVRSISSPFSADSTKATLSYAESYSLVDFLVKTFGSAEMLDLLETFKQGSTYDGAFQNVYGLDMDQLEKDWKSYLSRNSK